VVVVVRVVCCELVGEFDGVCGVGGGEVAECVGDGAVVGVEVGAVAVVVSWVEGFPECVVDVVGEWFVAGVNDQVVDAVAVCGEKDAGSAGEGVAAAGAVEVVEGVGDVGVFVGGVAVCVAAAVSEDLFELGRCCGCCGLCATAVSVSTVALWCASSLLRLVSCVWCRWRVRRLRYRSVVVMVVAVARPAAGMRLWCSVRRPVVAATAPRAAATPTIAVRVWRRVWRVRV
jgi:hypothetical protein